MAYTNEEIVEGIRRRSPDHLKYIMNEPQLRKTVRRYVVGKIENNNDLTSLIIDGLLELIKKIDNLDSPERWRNFVASTYRNIKFRRDEKNQRRENREKIYSTSSELVKIIQEKFSKKEVRKVLYKCIAKLTETCKVLIIGQYWEDKKSKEQAKELNFADQSLRNKRLQCKDELRKIIKNSP